MPSPGLAFSWKKEHSKTDVLICLGCQEMKVYENDRFAKHGDLTSKGNDTLLKLYSRLFKETTIPSP